MNRFLDPCIGARECLGSGSIFRIPVTVLLYYLANFRVTLVCSHNPSLLLKAKDYNTLSLSLSVA